VDSAALTAIAIFSLSVKLMRTLRQKGGAGAMLLSPEDYGKQRRPEKLRFRSVRIAARRRSQAAAIMAMKASRLTNKSKISKTDDVEYCVRYFSSVIFRTIFNLWAIFNANGPGTRAASFQYSSVQYLSGFPVIYGGLK
jgi:hypothetical protein